MKITPVKITQNTNPQLIKGVEFPKANKNDSIEDYLGQDDVSTESVKVLSFVELSPKDFSAFKSCLLFNQEWLAGLGGSESNDERLPEDMNSYTETHWDIFRSTCHTHALCVFAEGKEAIFVNPEGYSYARYVGFLPGFNVAGYMANEDEAQKLEEDSDSYDYHTQMAVIEISKAISTCKNDQAISVLKDAMELVRTAQEIGADLQWEAEITAKHGKEKIVVTATSIKEAFDYLDLQGIDSERILSLNKL